LKGDRKMQATSKHDILMAHTKFEKSTVLSDLVAHVVHDIRSPIAAMEMCLHMIEQRISENDFMLFKMAIQRVRDIANNLLDRHRDGKAFDTVLLKSILEQVLSLKRYEWLEKNCELVLSYNQDTASAKVDVIPNEIKRVLSNLLNNAIESCEHHAKIELCVSRVGEFIELSICDNGVGIPAEKIEKYLCGESSKHFGTGIGLSSAKTYMESIGGKLSLKSQLDVGTTVILKFSVL
jgi:signal transduction histidine kinase